MNKRQRLINETTKDLLKNEDYLYGKRITSFYRMRKFVKKEKLV